MKVCVLFNPKAGSSGQFEAIREALGPEVELRELGPDDDFASLARDAARGGYDLVAVAGGDGSVHAAACGLIPEPNPPVLAVLPLGTGNDFCRTMAIPLDPVAAVGLLKTGTPRTIDAARVDGCPTGYMVNAATGGFSGRVANEVTADIKSAWGPLAYLRGAVGPMSDPPRFRVTIRYDGGPPETLDVLNVVVANARMAAGGVPVAPLANPEDGKFDVVLVRSADTLDLSVIAARLMNGDYLNDENVVHRLAGRVEIESDPAIPFSVDGEACEGSRFAFAVVPKALRVMAGPGYCAAPACEPAVETDDAEEPASAPQVPATSLRQRGFGLVAGVLLLAKRAPAAVLVGFALIAVAVLVFAWLANGAVDRRWVEFNGSIKQYWAAHASPGLTTLAEAVTWLGGAVGTTVLVVGLGALFLIRKHYLTLATLLAVVAGVLLLEAVLKPAFAIARPAPLPFPVGGYAFPSGHALRGVGIFGLLAALTAGRGYHRGRPGWWVVSAGCAAVAAGVCWSRVYLGVHWATDVIAGGIAAAAWVAGCLVARYYAMRRRAK